MGTLALTRHQFPDALVWAAAEPGRGPRPGGAARRARRRADRARPLPRGLRHHRHGASRCAPTSPPTAAPPTPSSSRATAVSAIDLMGLAVDAGGPGTESRAWTRVQLGLLRFGGGDLDGAEREMRRALSERPGDARATAGLARVIAARGELDRARRALLPGDRPGAASRVPRRARRDPPGPGQAGGRARGPRPRGRDAEAARRQRLQRRPRHLGLIDADIHTPGAADIARARRGRASRPGVIGDQVLGWVLTRAGRCAEGDRYGHAQPAPGHPRRPDALPGRHGGLVRRPHRRRPGSGSPPPSP